MIDECIYARQKIIDKAKAEMLGPGSEGIGGDIRCEVISDSPVERYSLGILFPKNSIYGQDDNEKQMQIDCDENDEIDIYEENYQPEKDGKGKCEVGSLDLSDNSKIDEEISMANQTMPSAAGLTFFAKGKIDKLILSISVAKYRVSTFKDCYVKIERDVDPDKYLIGDYVYYEDGYLKLKKNISNSEVYNLVNGRSITKERPDIVEGLYKIASLCTNEKPNKHTGYVRIPFLEDKEVEVSLDNELCSIYIDEDGEVSFNNGSIKITVLKKKYGNEIYSYTVVMINENEGRPNYKNCLFQPQIKVSTDSNNFVFIEKSEIEYDNVKYMEESELVFNLLYRNKKSFAVGHGVATGQNVNMKTGKGKVFTDFFPSFEIPQLDFEIEMLGGDGKEILSMFNMSDISSLTKDKKIKLLEKFADAYERWINNQRKLGEKLKEKHS